MLPVGFYELNQNLGSMYKLLIWACFIEDHVDGLVRDCANSTANTLELNIGLC